ncbi:hypothetical protein KBA41_12955 [Candidatus Ozemobacteraceae bacterium]|nr:hypothetical protein [Candidatus Ozemobacteraceae bacterium]
MNGFSPPVRGLGAGIHPFLAILPGALGCPALDLIGSDRIPGAKVLESARVSLVAKKGYCWIDDEAPCIVLTLEHYTSGSDLDLYLDLLHEATHIRQVMEGRDVWDETVPYHRRLTEIEGYAVAVSECRRLGLDPREIRAHCANPWMTSSQVTELLAGIDAFMAERDRLREHKMRKQSRETSDAPHEPRRACRRSRA